MAFVFFLSLKGHVCCACRSGVEQSFAKADRCFHEGRFGSSATDTERRALMILSMDTTWDKEVVTGARRLYASAVKKHKGKQRKPRMDKGIAKGHFANSEVSFLKRKRESVREAMSSAPGESLAQENTGALSSKARKEMQLQNQRRLNHAIDAAENGYLLAGEDGDAKQAFAKLQNKKRKCEQQDAKRIEAIALRKQLCQAVCEHQTWNWKSLGARKAWSTSSIPAAELAPLVAVAVP